MGCRLNEAFSCFTSTILKIRDKYSPLQTKTVGIQKTSLDPWISRSIQKSIEKKNKLYNKWTVGCKSKTSDDYKHYKAYRNTLQRVIRFARKKFYTDRIQKFKGETKTLWSILNGLLKRKKSHELTREMIVNGIETDSAKTIANAFVKHYGEIGCKLAEKLNRPVDNPITQQNKKLQNFSFHAITEAQVLRTVQDLKNKTSSGIDGISNKFLKKIIHSIVKPYTMLINRSIFLGTFPTIFKKAVITPLYKGKEKNLIQNYRSISLLPVMSKILEKVVKDQVVAFFSKNRLLFEGQYGFHEGQSTSDALMDLVGNLIENFEKGLISITVQLDMSKAFDCLDHCKFLDSLKYYGFENVLPWFKTYLREREIAVKYDGIISDSHKLDIGTPQGSVLGPLYYILQINDFHKSLRYSSMMVYADDTTILISGCNMKCLLTKLETDLNNLYKCYCYYGLTVNLEKTNYLIFNYRQRDSVLLYMGDHLLQQEHHTKLLGLYIQNDLKWNTHIDNLCNKLNSAFYHLRANKKVLDRHTKLWLYNTLIESHICYGISLWGPSSQNTTAYTRINKTIMKITTELNISGDVLSLDNLINLYLGKISYRYLNNKILNRICNLFEKRNYNNSYNTRNRTAPSVKKHQTCLYNKSFLCKGPGVWLYLPDDIKSKPHLKLFSKNLKKHYLKSSSQS